LKDIKKIPLIPEIKGLPMLDSSRHPVTLSRLHLHLSDGCSLGCQNCWMKPVQQDNEKSVHFLPLSMAVSAVNEALPLGLKVVRLSGNDALFHPDLDSLLDQLESLELNVHIDTNGTGLNQQRVNRLARLPQASISVALNGADSATHDASTGAAGSFDYATRAVRVLAAAGMPVEVISTVRRRNAYQLADIVRLVERLGGDSLRFELLPPGSISLPKPNGKSNNGSLPYTGYSHPSMDGVQVEELIALGWRVERELSYTTPLHLNFDQPPAFRGLHPKAKLEGKDRCGVLDSLSITSTGEYTLCGLGSGQIGLVLGQAGKDSLHKVWNTHPTLQMLRAGLPDKLQGICNRCTVKSACNGRCVVENYLRTGSFWGPGWFCEAAEKVGLFPAGRMVENIW
jgi:SynChlorMet cassette radical SAM/SPASM protein ScmF